MWFCHLLCTTLFAAPTQSVHAIEPSETWDCAHSALYIFLSLDGRSCDPNDLRHTLPARREGISVAELAEAIRKLGVTLHAVRLSEQDCTRVGTFIALAEHEAKPHGHFLVARSIGQSYLQIIDPPQVQVVPIERMFPEPNSTVVALIRHRHDPRHIAGWIMLGAGPLFLLGMFVWTLRRRRRGAIVAAVQEPRVP